MTRMCMANTHFEGTLRILCHLDVTTLLTTSLILNSIVRVTVIYEKYAPNISCMPVSGLRINYSFFSIVRALSIQKGVSLLFKPYNLFYCCCTTEVSSMMCMLYLGLQCGFCEL